MNATGQPRRLHVPALEVVAARQRAGAGPGYLRAAFDVALRVRRGPYGPALGDSCSLLDGPACIR
jgi:hypothetical protein